MKGLTKFFQNLKVRASLLLGFGTIIVVSAALIIACLYMMTYTRTQFDILLDEDVAANENVLYCRVQSAVAGRNIRDILLVPDSEANDGLREEAEMNQEMLYESLEALQECWPSQLDRTYLNDYIQKAKTWAESNPQLLELYDKYHETGNQKYLDEAIDFIYTTDTPDQTEMVEAARVLDNQLVEGMEKERARVESVIASTIVIILVLFVIACIFCIGIALIIVKSITDPTEEVRRALVGFSEGKLDIPVTFESRNELGDMCNALRSSQDILNTVILDANHVLTSLASGDCTVKTQADAKYVGALQEMLDGLHNMGDQLNEVLSEITRSSEQIAAGTEQVANGSQALGQGATEQASAVEELSATLTEVSTHVQHNADDAVAANNLSNEAAAGVVKSNEYMGNLMTAMGEIDSTTGQIEKIIKTIEDIAFQTNILALNAAVEAARAGAAGKGFAVVADEVRSLAAKSAEAAKNTNDLISGTVGAVKNGVNIAGETQKALQDVVQKASNVTVKIDNIAKASEEQAEKIRQITEGIGQIAAVVHSNSATAEESAAACEELNSQTALIKSYMGRFKLADDRDFFSAAKAAASRVMPTVMPEPAVADNYVVEPFSAPVSSFSDKY